MAIERNAFTALCALASREKWCWNIHCTTCAHMHFRCGFFEIDMGKHPEREGWLTHREFRPAPSFGTIQGVTRAIRQSEKLHQVMADASLVDIAASCRFSDYLGYLGLGLHHTRELELLQRILSKHWGSQLLEMVEEESHSHVMLLDRMTGSGVPLQWDDLEEVERDMKQNFRTANDRSLQKM